MEAIIWGIWGQLYSRLRLPGQRLSNYFVGATVKPRRAPLEAGLTLA
jgi:hypothetical protein